jgi:hypothetical protein
MKTISRLEAGRRVASTSPRNEEGDCLARYIFVNVTA